MDTFQDTQAEEVDVKNVSARWMPWLSCALLWGCQGETSMGLERNNAPGEDMTRAPDTGPGPRPDVGADMGPPELCPPDPEPSGEVDDLLSPTRLMRRASMVLRGHPPTLDEYQSLESVGEERAQFEEVDAFIARSLQDPKFYRVMFEMGRDWFQLPLIPRTADAPEYGLIQQRALVPCAQDTSHPGAWVYARVDGSLRDDACQTPGIEQRTLEPWWKPGEMVTLVGHAASTSAMGQGRRVGNIVDIDCEDAGPGGTCGCGPNATKCYPNFQRYPGWEEYLSYNAESHRRLMSEEPARMFAHIAWHDRSIEDLVLGTYLVGPTKTQAAYVVQAARGGRLENLSDRSWWDPASFQGALADPEHSPDDPLAWREFEQPARNPFLLASRSYTYDPRVTTEPMDGLPAAGILTSMGMLSAWPRERLRAARLLEVLACESFAPPSADEVFNAYESDPATQGTCQHCHRRIDPAAIHFKRFAKRGSASEGWGASYLMPGIGDRWHWDARWLTGAYPYHSEPFSHWLRWYTPNTAMTPVTDAQVQANPEALFLDFLPPEQTLLGQTSDGTVGPLGFGKMIVAAGALDRCVVRKIHRQVLGRDIDPAAEAGYHDALVETFRAGDRKVRPFVAALMSSDLFKRGL